MKQIKHISLDVWGTLISANKQFSKARTEVLSSLLSVEPNYFYETYRIFKKRIEEESVNFGIAYTTRELILRLLQQMNVEYSSAEPVQSKLVQLFYQHPPIILPEIKSLIQRVTASGITLSIGSNSNFISGRDMFPWLQKEFENAFSFGVFSDLENTSKPDQVFFGKIFTRANQLQLIDWEQILHVGDNRTCDVVGPQHVGMQSLLVESPTTLSPTLLGTLHGRH